MSQKELHKSPGFKMPGFPVEGVRNGSAKHRILRACGHLMVSLKFSIMGSILGVPYVRKIQLVDLSTLGSTRYSLYPMN